MTFNLKQRVLHAWVRLTSSLNGIRPTTIRYYGGISRTDSCITIQINFTSGRMLKRVWAIRIRSNSFISVRGRHSEPFGPLWSHLGSKKSGSRHVTWWWTLHTKRNKYNRGAMEGEKMKTTYVKRHVTGDLFTTWPRSFWSNKRTRRIKSLDCFVRTVQKRGSLGSIRTRLRTFPQARR